MRTILILIFLLLFFIASLFLFLFEFILGKFNPHARDISSLRIVQWAFKVILFISGTKKTVIGLENIPKDEPVLFIGNHRSFFDVVLSYSLLPNITGYVAKKSLAKIPILSTWMRLLNCLFLDRDNIKEGLKTIITATEYVKAGKSIFIFPEGTRNNADGIGDFKEGSFKISTKTGCKIVPVVITNTNKIFEDSFPWIHSAKVSIEFCTPIDVKELSKDELKGIGAYTREKMLKIYEKNVNL